MKNLAQLLDERQRAVEAFKHAFMRSHFCRLLTEELSSGEPLIAPEVEAYSRLQADADGRHHFKILDAFRRQGSSTICLVLEATYVSPEPNQDRGAYKSTLTLDVPGPVLESDEETSFHSWIRSTKEAKARAQRKAALDEVQFLIEAHQMQAAEVFPDV